VARRILGEDVTQIDDTTERDKRMVGKVLTGNSTVPLALVLMASGCFALGHRQGQEKAARDAVTWLRLDG
jgi:hypothetical protein